MEGEEEGEEVGEEEERDSQREREGGLRGKNAAPMGNSVIHFQK